MLRPKSSPDANVEGDGVGGLLLSSQLWGLELGHKVPHRSLGKAVTVCLYFEAVCMSCPIKVWLWAIQTVQYVSGVTVLLRLTPTSLACW